MFEDVQNTRGTTCFKDCIVFYTNDFSPSYWSRAMIIMVDENTDHGNDVMVK